MNEHEQLLLRQLFQSEPPLLKRTFKQFVLEYGWWYEPVALPEGISMGPMKNCHKNAYDLALKDDRFIYCEGYALFRDVGIITLHSWVTDGQGKAIDNTWTPSGVAYAGVPFTTFFVTMTNLKNKASISLLDDWQNKYPLAGELGDRPAEWLETKRADGIARLNHDQRQQ